MPPEPPRPEPEAEGTDSPSLPSSGAAKRYHLIVFQSGDDRDPFGTMNQSVFERVQLLLDQCIDPTKSETEIDVWLESPGGSAHVAYKLFLDLQYRCRKLRAIIPDFAKSAATLLVMGGR